MNVRNRAVLGARICEHHAITSVLLQHKLLSYVALLNVVAQVVPVRLAGVLVQLESLSDTQAGFDQANIHQAGTAEIRINGYHSSRLRAMFFGFIKFTHGERDRQQSELPVV